jgi:hypothetical protein
MLTASGWERYPDHTHSVTLPPYLPDPLVGYVTPLSHAVPIYDFVTDDGPRYLGAWIDHDAQRVGR